MGRDQDFQEMRVLRQSRSSQFRRFRNGMYLTENEIKETREKYCSGCGREKKNPKKWFGEEFCGDCWERFSHGK